MAIQQKDVDSLNAYYYTIMSKVESEEPITQLFLSVFVRGFLENLALAVLANEEVSFDKKNKEQMIKKVFNTIIIPEEKKVYILGFFQKMESHYSGFDTKLATITHLEIKEHILVVWEWWQKYIVSTPKTLLSEKNEKRERFIALRSFHIENYQGIGKIEENDLPLDAHFIVFTGENGYGKTSILQAIAIAFYGNEDTQSKRFLSNAESCLISIAYRFPYKGLIFNQFSGYRNASDITPLKNFAAYGASRLQLQSEESMEQGIARRNPAYHLFSNDGILLNIEHWLNKQKAERKKHIIETLKEVLPSIDEVAVKHKAQSLSFKDHNDWHDVSTLSAGHKSIFAMIGDMMIRLFEAQPKAKKTTDLTGIVLIDELESHLHPKWQKEFPALLAKLFPKVQFIVTTHSAICFLGMPKNSVFFHVQKNENGKIGVEKLDIDLENLLPNHILTSPIFGMENIKHVENVDAQKVPTSELSYDEVKKRAETQTELKELAKKFVFPKNLQKK